MRDDQALATPTTKRCGFGVQTALQHTRPDELIATWRRIEDAGFDGISIWDHFYAVGGAGPDSLEAVAMHAALAATTTRVRCMSLVYSVDYRNLAVLANAIATIDHLSGGRVELGLGAGYLHQEYDAWGIPFDPPGVRSDRLAATIAALRKLYAGETVTMSEAGIELNAAVCMPTPVQGHLPIWVGGGGRQRTIPTAARLADGWNVPMAKLDDFREMATLLDREAELADRDPEEITKSVNLGLCWDPAELGERFGERAAAMAPAILSGSTAEVTDKVAQYRAAGADWVNVSVRAPFHVEELERFASEIMPEFA